MDTYFVFEYIFLVVGECLSTFFDGGGDDILEFGGFAHNYNVDCYSLCDQNVRLINFSFVNTFCFLCVCLRLLFIIDLSRHLDAFVKILIKRSRLASIFRLLSFRLEGLHSSGLCLLIMNRSNLFMLLLFPS